MAKMTLEEKIEWNELYQFVRTEIMGYDQNQSLSRTMALRLKGLKTSKFVENKNQTDMSNYSYKIILATFKYCKPKYEKALRTKKFSDEMHKFNYVLSIVESNLNDVYMRTKRAEKQKSAVDNIDPSMFIPTEKKNKIGKNRRNRKNYDTQKYIDKYKDMW